MFYSPARISARKKKRGMIIVILTIVILFIIGFLVLWHSINALHESELQFKRFNISTAMNLAEAGTRIALLHVEEQMNNGRESPYWYMALRKPVDSLKSSPPAEDLKNNPVVQSIASEMGGTIKTLLITLDDIDYFRDSAGKDVSINLEKCGSLKIECVASYRKTNVRVISKCDFKCIHVRHPILNSYTLFVRDAWGEYSACPVNHFPQKYKYTASGSPIPGSFYGYNSPEHLLYLNNSPEGAAFSGKVLLNGPMDTASLQEKRIILNLSDEDRDLMARIFGQDSLKLSPLDGTMTAEDFIKLINTSVRDQAKKIDRAKFEDMKQLYDIMEIILENRGFPAVFNNLPAGLPAGNLPGYPFTQMYLGYLRWASDNKGRSITDYTVRNDAGMGIELLGPNEAHQRKLVPVEGPVYARYTKTALLHMHPKDDIINDPSFPADMRNKLKKGEWQPYQGLPEDSELSDFEEYFKQEQLPLIKNSPDFDPTTTDEDIFYGVFGEGMREREALGYNTKIVIEPYNSSLKRAGVISEPLIVPNKDGQPYDPKTIYRTILSKSKCSNIYENSTDFLKEALQPDNTLVLNGNVFIGSDLTLPANLKYRGSGAVIVNGDITLTGNISRSPSDPIAVLTLYSLNRIIINGSGYTIQASLMAMKHSNFPLSVGYITGPGNEISGSPTSLFIIGNVCVDHLNLPSLARITKITYDPVLHELGTGDDYFISLSQKYSYWLKGY